MKRTQLEFDSEFHLAITSGSAQAAVMVIQPGDAEGNARNTHQGSDQWLFVVSGTGTAIINEHRYELKQGTLMLIERGDRHEIRADGTTALRTLNFYAPPAYRDDQTPTAAGRSNAD